MGTLTLMPQALDEKLKAIDIEVRNLYFKLKFFNQLFTQLFTDPKRVEILKATAASLFQSIEESMLFDILLSIARLTDPPRSVVRENLSFKNLLQEMPNGPLRMEIDILLSNIKQKTKDLETWRNKKLAHNDLQKKALGAFFLPPIQKKDLADILEMIPKAMNLIYRHFTDTEVRYDMCITSHDGDSLLFYLEYGLDAWEEDKRNQNLDRLHKLRKKRLANRSGRCTNVLA
jgi:hypothetical protein